MESAKQTAEPGFLGTEGERGKTKKHRRMNKGEETV